MSDDELENFDWGDETHEDEMILEEGEHAIKDGLGNLIVFLKDGTQICYAPHEYKQEMFHGRERILISQDDLVEPLSYSYDIPEGGGYEVTEEGRLIIHDENGLIEDEFEPSDFFIDQDDGEIKIFIDPSELDCRPEDEYGLFDDLPYEDKLHDDDGLEGSE